MATRRTGVTDKVLIQDSSDTEVTADLGWVQTFSYEVDEGTESVATIDGSANNAINIDGVIEITGSLETNLYSLKSLQVLGTYDSVAGTVTWDDSLPTFDAKADIDGSDVATISDLKFGTVTIDFEQDGAITMSADFTGKTFSKATESISPTTASTEWMQGFDASVSIGGSVVGSVESGSISFERSTDGIRGITSSSSRTVDEIKEKMKGISVDLTIHITDATAWSEVTTADDRSDTSLTLTTTAGDINLSGVRFQTLGAEKSNDGEVRTVDLSGTALSVTINNV